MARRAWLVDHVATKFSGSPRLLLDSGNFSDNPTAEGDVKTRGLVRAMSRLGYAAANVGDRDLSLGYDEFLARVDGAGFPFVSANVVRQDTREPVFEPFVIVEATSPNGKSKRKIGVLGVTRFNPLFLKSGPGDSSIVIVKPEVELQRYIDEVRAQSDLVVLLAALHKEEAKRIVRQVPGVDFVIGAYGGMITAREEKEGDTWLLYSGNQGKRVGETRVYLGPDGEVVSAETRMYLLTAQFPSDQPMLDYVNQVTAEALAMKKREQAGLTTGTKAAK